MAERSKVMISTDIAKEAAFLGLSDAAKLLYFQLVLASDWDGAIPSPRLLHVPTVQHPEAFDELVAAGLIFEEDDYALIADHWAHNKLDTTNWPKYSHPFLVDIEQHFTWDLEGTDRSYHRKAGSQSDVSLMPDNNVTEPYGGGVASATAPPEKVNDSNGGEGKGDMPIKAGDRARCPQCGTVGIVEEHELSSSGRRVGCPQCRTYWDLPDAGTTSTEKVTS